MFVVVFGGVNRNCMECSFWLFIGCGIYKIGAGFIECVVFMGMSGFREKEWVREIMGRRGKWEEL